ncbi:cyclodehydratase [Mycobacterium kyorinense]|uniref:Cyclodehydratase n=1 Tax=Mycobacterium kyorinense TaxID=487514 RepID=A0A1A2YTP7_9MYCO|nr:cyclodehydratase [Mycobacterium kyorinense]OBI40301.1 cyclodehydratase [Mycobacterium kyorinense]
MPQGRPAPVASPLYALDPAMPVVVRPDGAVQVGWDPRRAVLVQPPAGLTAAQLATLLRSMHTPTPMSALHDQAPAVGAEHLADLVAQLVEAGVVSRSPRPQPGRSASIRVHGRGPLSDLLLEALRCSGARIKHSSQPHAVVTSAGADLVVLSDYLIADPRLVRELHSQRVPHLAVRVRDGAGLVGPLVVPGVTSCLACADLHRRDRDAAWPAVAVQLRDTVGTADRATLLATAALALSQVNRVIGAVRGSDPGPPPAFNATLEFDVHVGSIVARHWPRHPLCSC